MIHRVTINELVGTIFFVCHPMLRRMNDDLIVSVTDEHAHTHAHTVGTVEKTRHYRGAT